MTAHILRLSSICIFTVEYPKRINTQIVYYPAQSVVVKPNELESALARPLLHSAYYEPEKTASHLAATTLSYGIIKGHPFMDGNKRTGIILVSLAMVQHSLYKF